MIYQNIKRIAKSKNISIKQIEDDLEITPRYMCKWNKITPKLQTLLKVANYLGTTVEELVNQ